MAYLLPLAVGLGGYLLGRSTEADDDSENVVSADPVDDDPSRLVSPAAPYMPENANVGNAPSSHALANVPGRMQEQIYNDEIPMDQPYEYVPGTQLIDHDGGAPAPTAGAMVHGPQAHTGLVPADSVGQTGFDHVFGKSMAAGGGTDNTIMNRPAPSQLASQQNGYRGPDPMHTHRFHAEERDDMYIRRAENGAVENYIPEPQRTWGTRDNTARARVRTFPETRTDMMTNYTPVEPELTWQPQRGYHNMDRPTVTDEFRKASKQQINRDTGQTRTATYVGTAPTGRTTRGDPVRHPGRIESGVLRVPVNRDVRAGNDRLGNAAASQAGGTGHRFKGAEFTHRLPDKFYDGRTGGGGSTFAKQVRNMPEKPLAAPQQGRHVAADAPQTVGGGYLRGRRDVAPQAYTGVGYAHTSERGMYETHGGAHKQHVREDKSLKASTAAKDQRFVHGVKMGGMGKHMSAIDPSLDKGEVILGNKVDVRAPDVVLPEGRVAADRLHGPQRGAFLQQTQKLSANKEPPASKQGWPEQVAKLKENPFSVFPFNNPVPQHKAAGDEVKHVNNVNGRHIATTTMLPAV